MAASDPASDDIQLFLPSLDGAASPSGSHARHKLSSLAGCVRSPRAFLRLGQSGDLTGRTGSGFASTPPHKCTLTPRA